MRWTGFGHTCGVRVLKMDGPSAQGFLGLTAFQAEGCGIARRAMSIKSALRDLLSVSYDMISILVISRYAAPPYPAAPDFLHGKACHTILRSLCSLTNRVPLPPLFRGQNKTPRNTLFINGSTVSAGYSAPVEVLHRTSKWGEIRRLACPLRRFLFAAPPNCGGGKGTGFIGEPRDPRIQ